MPLSLAGNGVRWMPPTSEIDLKARVTQRLHPSSDVRLGLSPTDRHPHRAILTDRRFSNMREPSQ
eukprot:5388361-Prymnesium_polylepis.1